MLEDVVLPIVAILSVFVFCPLAIAYSVRIWRAPQLPPEPRMPDEHVRRMQELQTSMDAMAVEIERIAEGQRFVTKLMSERPAGELAAPQRTSKSQATRRGS
jgi:hypothetical protein